MNESIKHQIETLNRQMNELTAIYHREVLKHGISDKELWVLYALIVFEGDLSQQDICHLWSLSKQTVNSVINTMKKKGYLFLEEDPKRRNSKIIQLTEKGRAFGEKTVQHFYEAEERSIAQFSEKDRQLFISLLEKYITSLAAELASEKVLYD
ncbi:MarR family winged helix-turn-helix transcriptional regulator [Amphibacillus sp. Q70]|uniref:MarR family winged helix-turn-helix transcriptional regulator n=1 Tax=Amphibacillus sp. Q70 TaxID=3453416 RepID=UPI003F83567A